MYPFDFSIRIMGTLLSYLVIYIIYIIIILKKKLKKTERMLRIEYNVIQNYAEKMAAQSKKRFRFDNVLLLGLEGSNVF